MRKNPDGQVELVLENRQVLLIFFVIVAFCGVFFSLGYIVGRNTFSSVSHVAQAASGGAEAVSKPSPMPPPANSNRSPQNSPDATTSSDQAAPATDLSFYQSAEQKAPEAKLVPPETPNSPASDSLRAPAAEKQPAAETPEGIFIQVSALTRREDADALVALFKEKKLPVVVTNGTNDTLFHVLVGPYKNEKDALHAKAILELDGFRPIIKH